MSQLSLRFCLDRDATDRICDALLERGAVAVNVSDAQEGTSQEQPIFGEPGADTWLWDACEVSALFAEGALVDEVRAVFLEACDSIGVSSPTATIDEVADLDWVQQNRDQFQPIQVSDRVWIVPTWHDAPDVDAINIALDPGAAFGTGSHPTTRLCLQWIEAQVDERCASFLDYGTGSGILAIAAKKFGAHSVVGTDIDPLAVEAARANAAQNEVDVAFYGNDQALDFVADVTVANILANPLKVLAPLLAAHTRSGGKLALAGLLDEQADELIAIYAPYFDLTAWRSAEGWTCLAGSRR